MGISSTLPALRVGGSSELALLPSESGKEAGVGGRSQRVLASPLLALRSEVGGEDGHDGSP